MDFVEYTVGDVFGIPKTSRLASMKVKGGANPDHPMIPKRKRHLFREAHLADLIAWWGGYGNQTYNEGYYLWGPHGSGKSSLFLQFAARLNIPVFSMVGRGTLEFEDLVGMRTLVDGDTLFMDGALTAAMREGVPFLLNEGNAVKPDVSIGLNDVLDGMPLVLTENGGDVVKPAEGFRIVTTANTNGKGDDTGGYAGTLVLNDAYRDRYVFRYIDYPTKDEELLLMHEALSDIPSDVRDVVFPSLIDVANLVRERFKGQGTGDPLNTTFSTRTLIRWAQQIWYFRTMLADSNNTEDPVLYALDHALAGGCDEMTREALREITQRAVSSVTT